MTLVIATLAGEIGVKGRTTRSRMVKELIRNVKAYVSLSSWSAEGGVLVLDVDGDPSPLSRVFGIARYAIATEVLYSDLNDLVSRALPAARDSVKGRRFAVRARRVGESRFTSLDVERELGAALRPFSAGVDLESPDVTVNVYIRAQGLAYVYTKQREGGRGLPVGVAGRTVALVSGGIDSPVAAWMMMRRGVVPVILNLAIGREQHKRAVLEEARALRVWSGAHDLRVYFIDGLPVLSSLVRVREPLRVVALKRVMYRLAEALARKVRAHSITTGESLSQASSQTMWNLDAEERGISIPILRPLIALDKDEIIGLARRIGTYEVSSRVPEYCAVAQASTTMAMPEEVDEAEGSMGVDYDALVRGAEVYFVTQMGVKPLAGKAGQVERSSEGS
ncbi:MAG: tRNA sulfurtransferase [Acidilobus sp.]